MNSMKINCDDYLEVLNFYYREAELLDFWKYREWLQLVTDDIEYIFYSRLNIESDSPSSQLGAPIIMDNRVLLEKRIERLYSEYAWAEIPKSFIRHHISNIMITEVEKENQIRVLSSVLLFRHKQDNPYYELMSYERHDVLRRIDGRWKLAKREIIPDFSLFITDNLSNIY
ncbi:aromatic-ring-hydroxylating dioxygenase subunit beta [Sulfolobus acidocaldarius SUSAZ]|nr:aromatic-ring-hydroxylating dioxygenase subunit beta [Sulfolobus acidocaldarius SUSAZ]